MNWRRAIHEPCLANEVLAGLLAFALALPALGAGRMVDDHIHQALLHGTLPRTMAPWDLFNFADGNSAHMRVLMSTGPYGWWTEPGLKLHFFRPLSSLLIQFDDVVSPVSAVWPHLHSILWSVLTVLAVARLLRYVVGGRTAAWAVLLYAVSSCHWMPVVWLANRNALVAAAPALWGLVAWVRWRQSRSVTGAWLWPLGLVIGLCGGETALGVVALWACLEGALALNKGQAHSGQLGASIASAQEIPLQRQLVQAVPTLAVLLLWAFVYRSQGFGAKGSGAYLDPMAQPVEFMMQAPGRILALIGQLLAGAPVDLWAVHRGWRWPLVIAGLLSTSLVLRIVWRAQGPERLRLGPWALALGSLLALLPAAATFPASRLLTVPSIGSCLLISMVFQKCSWALPAQASAQAWRGWQRLVARWLVVVHVVVAPLTVSGFAIGIGYLVHLRDPSLRQPLWQQTTGRVVILPVAPDALLGFYTWLAQMAEDLPRPDAWLSLSLAMSDHQVQRPDQNTLELMPLGEPMLASEAEGLLRSPMHGFVVGDRVDLKEFSATVLEVDGTRPRRVRFAFKRPLEDPHYVFIHWKDSHFELLPLPAIGQTTMWQRTPGVLGL